MDPQFLETAMKDQVSLKVEAICHVLFLSQQSIPKSSPCHAMVYTLALKGLPIITSRSMYMPYSYMEPHRGKYPFDGPYRGFRRLCVAGAASSSPGSKVTPAKASSKAPAEGWAKLKRRSA